MPGGAVKETSLRPAVSQWQANWVNLHRKGWGTFTLVLEARVSRKQFLRDPEGRSVAGRVRGKEAGHWEPHSAS